MRIVFGHNNFVIKTYTPEELGIFNEQGVQGIKFQIRQRYAHLFWIPFFPIGKLWVVKKEGNDMLYVMPEDIKSTILSRHGNPGTPWYSFTLILIGAAVWLYTLLGDAIDSQKYKNSFYNTVEETKMFIKYPTTGDCYIFTRYDQPDSWNNTSDIILKVLSYDDKKTRFISLYQDLYKDAEPGDRYEYFKSFDLAEAYGYNPTMIAKTDLLKTFKDDYEKSKKPVKLEPLEGYYVLEKIDRRKLEE